MPRNETPLAKWLRVASIKQRQRAAELAGLESPNYLYQIAALRREPKVSLALKIEDAMRVLNRESRGTLPIVTARDLADAWAMGGLS